MEFVEAYLTDSFLLACKEIYVPEGRCPPRYSQTGEKQTESWEISRIVQWAGRKSIEWHLVPTGEQHFNWQAKRILGILKKLMQGCLQSKRYTYEETCTLLQETVQIVHSRPI
jgi:hypothetical protein